MKGYVLQRIGLLAIILLSFYAMGFSQQISCTNPAPICTQGAHEYPLNSLTSIPLGNHYGCLASGNTPWSPSPLSNATTAGWFYFQAASSGAFNLILDSDDNISVAVWGPFANVGELNANCGALSAPISCSANSTGQAEYIGINGVSTGNVYLMLVVSDGFLPSQFSFDSSPLLPHFQAQTNCNIRGNLQVSCPGAISVEDCDEDLPAPYPRAFDFAVAGGNFAGNCSGHISISSDITYFSEGTGCPNSPRSYVRTYYFADECGNVGQCHQSIVFEESSDDPIILCPPIMAITCHENINPEKDFDQLGILTDCNMEYTVSIIDSTSNGGGWTGPCDFSRFTYVVQVEDKCGRTETCELQYAIIGNDPLFADDINPDPEICEIAPLYKECGDPFIDHDQLIEDWIDNVQALNNCGSPVTITNDYSEDNFRDTCGLGGIQVVTFTAKDACGRKSTCTGTIFSLDTKPPSMAIDARDEIASCNENVDSLFQAWLDNHGGALAVDCCGRITWTYEPADVSLPAPCGGSSSVEVTFFANDECGLFAETTATFSVEGDATLTLVSPAMDVSMACDADPELSFQNWLDTQGGAIATTCGTPSWSTIPENPILGNFCNSESVLVTFVASDGCGESVSTVASFTITDNDAPDLVFNNPILNDLENGAVLTYECDETIPSFTEADVFASDNCGNTQVFLAVSDIVGNCSNDGFLAESIYQWGAIDDCNNTASLSIKIRIVDTTAPVFTFVPSDANGTATASDNCDNNVNITFQDTQGNTACSSIRTWTATDHCGNSISTIVNIEGGDNNPPVFTFVPADATIDCNETAIFPEATASDNEGSVSISFMDSTNATPSSCANGGAFTVVRTWTATDNCGNTTTASSTITAVDNTPPAFTFVPQDLTFFCNETVMIPQASAEDNCTDVSITFVDVLNEGATTENCNNGFGYDIYRTWIATDACGNTATALTETWVVPEGYTGPVFTFAPANRMIACGENPSFDQAVCESACGNVSLTFEDTEMIGDCNNETNYMRTWTGIDDCGNIAKTSQTLSVPKDTEAPTFDFVPADKMITCGETPVFGTPTCYDNCANIDHLNIQFEDTELSASCAYQRTWTVTDACGNMAKATQRIDVSDTEAPVFNKTVEDKVVTCSGTVIFDDINAWDDCSATTLTFEDIILPSEATCSALSIHQRTWTATDLCGNMRQMTQKISIADHDAPTFTFTPVDQTIVCGETVEFDTPNAIDDCGEAVEITYEDEDITDCTMGNRFKRTWTATDACGNATQISQTIASIPDEVAPTFDNTLTHKVFACGEEMKFDNIAAIDNCTGVELTFEDEVLSSTCIYNNSIQRTWTAVDGCGNMASIAQIISTEDNDPPVVMNTLEDKTIGCQEAAPFDEPIVHDDCSEVTVTFEDVLEEAACNTTLTRTWTLSDACGNATIVSQSIREEDVEAPVFVNGNAPIITVMTYEQYLDWTPALEATDNCSEVSFHEVAKTTNNDCEAFSYLYTWEAVDACGNAATTMLLVEITDAIPAIELEIAEDMYCGTNTPINALIEGGIPPFSLDWSIDGNANWAIQINDNGTPELIGGTGSATLSLSVTNGEGCETIHSRELTCTDALTNTQELDVLQNLSIMPNPVSDQLSLQFQANTSDDATITIYDMLGQKIQTTNTTFYNGTNQFSLDVNRLGSATYVLIIETKAQTFYQKFVKL